jgi:hypothetical protein
MMGMACSPHMDCCLLSWDVLVKRTADSSGFAGVTDQGKKNTGFCFMAEPIQKDKRDQ